MTHFYGTLAEWWPVLSPLEDYAEEAREIQRLIVERRPDAQTLLELGSGGGHVAHFLAPRFECCLTDISAEMLTVSRRLNSGCAHVQGDMRTLDLGRAFDVVLVHDAIDYITSEDDLARVFDVAWRHLRPGGIAVLVPDTVAETFEPGESVSGGEASDGRAARLLEWVEAAAPGATRVAVHYAFLLRDADGRMHSMYERHEAGVFPEVVWTRALAARGFDAEVVLERTSDARRPRRFFVGHKPANGARTAHRGDAHDAHR